MTAQVIRATGRVRRFFMYSGAIVFGVVLGFLNTGSDNSDNQLITNQWPMFGNWAHADAPPPPPPPVSGCAAGCIEVGGTGGGSTTGATGMGTGAGTGSATGAGGSCL